jgi:pimeloyl-ACP methyl ester carboxylesterase
VPFARAADKVRIYYEAHGSHRRVRGSRLVVLSPASHFGNRDQPEVWNRTVLEFLARCDRRARG